MTLAELRAYLAEMTERAHRFDVEQNAESIAAQMWKHFTPQALSLWTTAGALGHIAECLSPPEADGDEERNLTVTGGSAAMRDLRPGPEWARTTEDTDTMTIYTVTVRQIRTFTIRVEADNDVIARALAVSQTEDASCEADSIAFVTEVEEANR